MCRSFRYLSGAIRWMLVTAASLLAAPLAADIAIVTGASTPVEPLDVATVRQLWLGETERIGGMRVKVAERDECDLRQDFYRQVLGKTRGQMKAIRAMRSFQHAVAPPPEFPSDQAVLRWIREERGRLGYVERESADDSVRILLVIEIPDGKESD